MVPSSSCCLNLFIRLASNAFLVTIVRYLPMRENEGSTGQCRSRLISCVLHRACGCSRTGRPDPQCARHSRRVRDDSVSRSSRSSLGTSPALSLFLPFFFVFSPSYFLFLVDASSERDFQICRRVSPAIRSRISGGEGENFWIAREDDDPSRKKNFTRSDWCSIWPDLPRRKWAEVSDRKRSTGVADSREKFNTHNWLYTVVQVLSNRAIALSGWVISTCYGMK